MKKMVAFELLWVSSLSQLDEKAPEKAKSKTTRWLKVGAVALGGGALVALTGM